MTSGAGISNLYSAKIEAALKKVCVTRANEIPPRLSDAMSYSLLAGGKRLRPSLCLAAAERSRVAPDDAMPMAAALEFMHTASLIHDDLPCMDDDDLRRGVPSNHKKFGECLAVLAGDALMIWSFGFALSGLLETKIPAERALRAVAYFADASGPAGMCGGQALDTDAASRSAEGDFAYRIAEKKTAALIRASVVCGAALGETSEEDLERYQAYGRHLGIAFQIVDDILDATSTAEVLGKTPRKDAAQDKSTFVSAYGLEEASRLAKGESEAAADAISPMFPGGDPLIDLARELACRRA
jgi:geranylgeranyl diphosphate synthase type II